MNYSTADKSREARLRRMARRQALALQKDRTRDPHALDYGRWYVVDPDRNLIVAGGGHRMTLDDVERYLTTPRGDR